MRIIVTGGAGFVGTNLIKRLLKEGHKVFSIDNYSTGKKENKQKDCVYINVDINNLGHINKLFSDIDIIFHMAALARVQPSFKKPKETVFTNVNGTLSILNLAKENNTPVIYAGSSSFHHGLYTNIYSWSKHAGEQLCKLYSDIYGLNIAICRFYNVYGPYQLEDGEYSTVLGIFEKQYRNNELLTVIGNGKQRKGFTHIDDIVDGLYKCIGKEFKAEIFELGRGINYSINEVVDMFETEKKYIPLRDGEYNETLCDYTKASKLLGWKPKINLQDYINKIKKTAFTLRL